MATPGIHKRDGKRGTTYQATVDLPRGADGRRRQKRKSFKRRKEAVDWRTKTINDLRQSTYIEPSMMPLGEYLDHWLETSTAGGNSKRNYASVIKNHHKPALRDIPIGRLTGAMIQEFYARGRTVLARPGILHQILNSALKQAVAEGLIPRNPAADLRVPRPAMRDDDDRVRVWSADQLRHFLNATREHRDGAAFWVAAHTGMRAGEIVALRWQDVDLEARTIRVEQNQTRDRDGKLRTGRTKTSAGRRTIGIDAETVMVLRGQRAVVQGWRDALSTGWQDHDLVFPQVDGRPRQAGDLGSACSRAVRRIGLPAITFHGLRHTHASLLLATGRPVHYVSRRLGHANIGITLSLYAHLIPGTETDDAEAFAAIMRGARETS